MIHQNIPQKIVHANENLQILIITQMMGFLTSCSLKNVRKPNYTVQMDIGAYTFMALCGFQAESLRDQGSLGEDSKALRYVVALEMTTGVKPHLFQGIHPERAPGRAGQGLCWRVRIYGTFSGCRQSQVFSLTVMPVFFVSSSSYPSPMPPSTTYRVQLASRKPDILCSSSTDPVKDNQAFFLLPKFQGRQC